MQFAPCYKIFIVKDPGQALLCMDRMQRSHPHLEVKILSDLDECILRISQTVRDQDLLWFNFYYYDDMVVALPRGGTNPVLGAYFLVDNNSGGIALDVVLISKTPGKMAAGRMSDHFFTHPHSTVISAFYKGNQIKRRTGECINHLLARLELLETLKSILPMNRDYPSFDELLDSCFKKLLYSMKARSGVLRLSQKSPAKQIFIKEYGEESLTRLISQLPQPHQRRLRIKDIAANAGTSIEEQIKSLGVRSSCSAGIHSKFAEGHFLITTDYEKIDRKQIALLEVFRTQLAHFLDNTLYFQDLLKILNQNASLVAPQETGVMVVDTDRRVIDIDPAAEELTGWHKKEAVGRHCSDLWQSCDFFGTPLCNTSRCPMQKALYQGQSILGKEVKTVKKSGARRFVTSDYLLDYDNRGQIKHGISFVKDVTDRIHLQERFHRLEQMARLGNFASELAHEIRNPVTGISSSAQYLFERAELNAEHKKVVEEILMGAQILEGTVKKYLGLARYIEPNLQRSQLNIIIQDVIKALANEMQKRGIILKTDFEDDLPEIFLDIDQMRQVYMNIIMNAIEAMPDGGLILIKTYFDVRDNGEGGPPSSSLVSIVRDSGKGIRPCDSGRVFDAFYTTKPGGSGLGLFTSQNILRKHEAEIQVVSEMDSGTEIIISFPLKANDG